LADKYIIDSSSIIDLFRWYPPDMGIFKPIWGRIERIVNDGILISHFEVYREIERRCDEAREWCRNNRKMFLDLDDEQVVIIGNVREKYEENYWNTKINQTAPWADPWLIALAIQLKRRGEIFGMNTEVKIVTQENKNKRNNIPRIAQEFGFESLKLIEFFPGYRYKVGVKKMVKEIDFGKTIFTLFRRAEYPEYRHLYSEMQF